MVEWLYSDAIEIASTNGCRIDGHKVYAVSEGSPAIGHICGDIRFYRADSKYINLSEVKTITEDDIFLYSKVRGAFLCADCYYGVLVGFTEKWISSITLACDDTLTALVNYALRERKQWFQETIDGREVTVKVKHVKNEDTLLLLSLRVNDFEWQQYVNPEGGNTLLFEEADIPEITYDLLQKLDKYK